MAITEGKKVSLSKLNRSNTFEKIFDCIDNNFTKLANVINSGSLNTSIEIEEFIAREYQTNFTLRDTFIPGTNALVVYVNNARQWEGSGFEEVGNQAFTLSTPVELGTLVKAVYIRTDPEFIKIENVYDDNDITDSPSQTSGSYSSGATGVQIAATDLAKVNEAIRQIQSMMIEVQSYVHGGTGSRRGESTDNATYLFNECQRMVREIRTLRDELKTAEYTIGNEGDVLLSELSASMIAYGQTTVDDTLKGFELTLSALQTLINSIDSSGIKYKNTTVELKIDSIMTLLTDFNNKLYNTTVPADIEEKLERLQNSVTALSKAVSGTINANSVVYDDTGLTLVDELSNIERSIRLLDLKVTREATDIDDNIESVRNSITRVSDLVNRLSNNLSSDESTLDRLNRTVNGMLSDIDLLKNTDDGGNLSSDRVLVGRLTLTEKLNQLTTFVDNLENSLSSTSTNVASINRKVNEVSDNYELLDSNMTSLDRKLTKQLNSIATEVEEIEESVDTLNRQTTRNISGINVELQEVTNTATVLNQKVTNLTDRINTVEALTGASALANLTSGSIKLEETPEKTLTSKLTDIDRNIELLNTTSDLLTAKVNNVSNKLNDLTEEDKDLSSDIANLDRKITTNCRNMLDDISDLRSSFNTLESNTASQIRSISSGLDDSVSLLDNFKKTTRNELNDIYERLESINQVQATLQSGEDIIISGRLTASDVKSGDTNVQVILNELESKIDSNDKKITKLSNDTTDEFDSIRINATDLNNRLRQTNTNLGNLSDSVDKNAEDIGKLNRYVDRVVNEVRTESETFDSNVMKSITSIENRLTDINTNLEALNNATLSSGDLDSITTANLTASNISYGISSNVKVKLDTLTNDLEYLNSRTSNKINEVKLSVESLDDKTKKLETKVNAITADDGSGIVIQSDLIASNIEYESNSSVKDKLDDLTNNQEYLDLKYSSKTDSIQRNVSSLDSDLRQLNRDINSTAGQLINVNENIASLESKSTRVTTAVNSLSSEFAEASSNAELAHREINRKITVLINDLDLLDTDTKKDIKELKNRLDVLSNISLPSDESGNSQIVSPTNAINIIYGSSNVKVKLDELTEELNNLDLQTTRSINSVKSDLSELTEVVNSNNNKTNRSLSSLQSGMEDLDSSLISLTTKTNRSLTKVQTDLESITDDITYLTTRTNKSITDVQNDLELLETNIENSIRTLNNRIDNIGVTTVVSGEDTISGSTSLTASDITYENNQNVKQKIDSLSDDISLIDNKYSKAVSKIQSSISSSEEDLESLSTRVNSFNTRLQSSIDSLEEDFSDFSVRTNREIVELKITNENLKADLDKNARDIKNIKDNLTGSQSPSSGSGLETLNADTTWNTIVSDSQGGIESVPIEAISAEDVIYKTSNVKDKLDSLDEDIDALNTTLTKKERTLQLNIETVEDSINSLSSRATKQINQLSDRVDYCEDMSNNLTQKVNRKISEFTDTLIEASDKINEFDSKVTGLVTRDSIDSAKVIFEENSNVHDQLVEILGLLRQLTSNQQESIPSSSLLNMILPNNAGSHNGIFRGNDLGTEITLEQSRAIKAGTFEDIFVGDYWTFRGKKYYVAGLDLFLNTGPDSIEDIYTENIESNIYPYINPEELNNSNFLTNFDDSPSITSTNDEYKLKDHHLVLIPEEILDLSKALSVTDTLAMSQELIPSIITIPSGDDTITPGGDDTIIPGGDDTLPSASEEDIYRVPYEYIAIDSDGNSIHENNIVIIGTSEKALNESLSLVEASLTTRALESLESKEQLISFLSETDSFSNIEEELTRINSDFDNISILTLFNIQVNEEIQSMVNSGKTISITFDVPEVTTNDSVLVIANDISTNTWRIISSSIIADGKVMVEFNHFCLVMIFKVTTSEQPGGNDSVTVEPSTPFYKIVEFKLVDNKLTYRILDDNDNPISYLGNLTYRINENNEVEFIVDNELIEYRISEDTDIEFVIIEGKLYYKKLGEEPEIIDTVPSGNDTLEPVDTLPSGSDTLEPSIPEGRIIEFEVIDNQLTYRVLDDNIPIEITCNLTYRINENNEVEFLIEDELLEYRIIGDIEFIIIEGNLCYKKVGEEIDTITPDTTPSSVVTLPSGGNPTIIGEGTLESLFGGIDINDILNPSIEGGGGNPTIETVDSITGETIKSEIVIIEPAILAYSDFDRGVFNGMFYNGSPNGIVVKPPVLITISSGSSDSIEDSISSSSIGSGNATVIYGGDILNEETLPVSIKNSSEFDGGAYEKLIFNNLRNSSIEINLDDFEDTLDNPIDEPPQGDTLIPDIPISIPVSESDTIISEFDNGYYNVMVFNGNKFIQLDTLTVDDDSYVSIPNTPIEVPTLETESTISSRWNLGIFNVMIYDGEMPSQGDTIIPVTLPPEESITPVYSKIIEFSVIDDRLTYRIVDNNNNPIINTGSLRYRINEYNKVEFIIDNELLEYKIIGSNNIEFVIIDGNLAYQIVGEIIDTIVPDSSIPGDSRFDIGCYNVLIYNGEGISIQPSDTTPSGGNDSVDTAGGGDSSLGGEDSVTVEPIDTTPSGNDSVTVEPSTPFYKIVEFRLVDNKLTYRILDNNSIITTEEILTYRINEKDEVEFLVDNELIEYRIIEDFEFVIVEGKLGYKKSGETPEIIDSILPDDSRFNIGYYNIMLFNGKDKSLVTLPSEGEITQGGGNATIINQESISPEDSISNSSYVIYSSEFDSGYYNVMTYNSHTSISAEGIIEPEIAQNIPIITEEPEDINLIDGEIPVTRVIVPTVDAEASVDANFNSGYYNVARFDGTKIIPQIDSIDSEEKEEGTYTPVITPPVIVYSEFDYGEHNRLILNGDKNITYSFDNDLVYAEKESGNPVHRTIEFEVIDNQLTYRILDDNNNSISGLGDLTYRINENNEVEFIVNNSLLEYKIIGDIEFVIIEGKLGYKQSNEIPEIIDSILPDDSRFNIGYYNVLIYNGSGISLPPFDTTEGGDSSLGENDSVTIQPINTVPSGTDDTLNPEPIDTTPSGNDTLEPSVLENKIVEFKLVDNKLTYRILDDNDNPISYLGNLTYRINENNEVEFIVDNSLLEYRIIGDIEFVIIEGKLYYKKLGEEVSIPSSGTNDSIIIEPSISTDSTNIFRLESGKFEVSIYDGDFSITNNLLTQFAVSDNLTFNGHRKSWYTRKTFEDKDGKLYSKWIKVDYRLLTEVAVFGARIHGKAERTEITSQFPIFKLSPEFIRIGQDYWLSDMVAKSNNVCMVTKEGESFYADAEEIKGIRPFFVIG